MTQLACPLCGRHVSLARFDPSDFDDDINGIEVAGLGRGRGFVVTDRFSLLDDSHLTRLISTRCRRILALIEGEEPASGLEMRKLRKIIADWAAWGVEAQKTIAQKDVEINKQGAENRRLGGELNNLHEQLEQSGPSVFAAEAEHLREENRRWQVAYANLQGSINAKDAEISDLKARNQQLKKEKATLGEQLEASEGENIYVVEMEELLERINDSSNTDYNNLSDAIDYLLEE